MTIEHVLYLVDEFGRAMRDDAKQPGNITPAALNQQRERLHDAIRALARGESAQQLEATATTDAVIAAAARVPAPVGDRLTTDPNDPRLTHGNDDKPVRQAEVYLVLSQEERAKGFVRPYRDAYKHVGLAPEHPLRDLTDEERESYGELYAKFETYPQPRPDGSSSVGRFWTQAQLDTKGCNTVTTMGRALSETYARDPKFYGGTYCVKCAMHRPVAEFRWYEMDGTIGPVVGS